MRVRAIWRGLAWSGRLGSRDLTTGQRGVASAWREGRPAWTLAATQRKIKFPANREHSFAERLFAGADTLKLVGIELDYVRLLPFLRLHRSARWHRAGGAHDCEFVFVRNNRCFRRRHRCACGRRRKRCGIKLVLPQLEDKSVEVSIRLGAVTGINEFICVL